MIGSAAARFREIQDRVDLNAKRGALASLFGKYIGD
jgi:hypothetical protein